METRPLAYADRLKSRLPPIVVQVASFVKFAILRFINDGMTQAAGALTYSTLLALVPLLVITFAILSGFPAFDGVKEQMEHAFLGALVPETSAEVQRYLGDFAGNATNLTAVGTVALAVTAVLLLSTIETTLNQVWRVERPRPFAMRMLIFWTILTLGPLLLGASFAQTSTSLAALQAWGEGPTAAVYGIEQSFSSLSWLVSLVLQIAAFTLLFMLVPARPVRLREAAIGGTISGLAFEALGWGFNSFLTSGSTYETIYGAVAAFPIFLVWIYSSWTVIILGAVFAAAFPDWWKARDRLPGAVLIPSEKLSVAVALLSVLSERAREGGAVSLVKLQEIAPLEAREEVLEGLIAAGWIVQTEEDCVVLARDLHSATLSDLAADLGLSLGPRRPGDGPAPGLAGLDRETGDLPVVLAQLERAEADVLGRPVAGILPVADPAPADEPVAEPAPGAAAAGGPAGIAAG